MKEEMDFDVEGGLVFTDRMNIVIRVRFYFGKVFGYVLEIVLEEIGLEFGSLVIGMGGVIKEMRKTVLLLEGKSLEVSRVLLVKFRVFILYLRSFFVEGREILVFIYRELEVFGLDDYRIKRKDDNLFLFCVIGFFGSFF